MKQQGLFYYYHTFAKTLDALNLQMLEDNDGGKHDWRKELAENLTARQLENGSWVNTTPRWYEGDPNLATAFSLLALSYCEPQPVE
jgi:squalene-hopene/tetraprenyl-beta-curcumene cyclase